MTVAAEASPIRVRTRAAGVRWPWIDLGLATLIVLAAGLARLPRLDYYTISFPEGIRAEQLLLMAAGYRPCVEIFCNQGPLLFYALYPTFLLFGQTLEAVRSGVVLFSLVGVAATYWVGHLIGGRPAAVVAAVLVALSPTYLKFSRLALAEVPAIAPAVLAVGAALLFHRSGRTAWLVAAALLVGLSLLLKPVTLMVCVPVGLFVLLRAERRWRNVGLLVAVTGLTIAIPTLLIGFSEILEQVVAFRLRSRGAEGRGIGWNWGRIVEELAHDRAGLFALAVAGAAVLAIRLRAVALPLIAWMLASLLLLLVHTPLHGKHIATLIPPAAILAGAGLGLAWRAHRQRVAGDLGRAMPTWLPLAAMAIVGLAYVVTLPAILARDHSLMFSPEPLESDPAGYWYPEVIATLGAVTGPDDVIVTDHPYLTFRARRLVPPPLVESSVTRILASSLTPEDAIEEATRYDADALLLWADKLTTMRQFKTWADRTYVPVRVYAADGEAMPTLYVRPELVDRARTVLQPTTPHRLDLEFEGGIRLAAFGVDRDPVPAGESFSVNLAWEATERPAGSFQAVVSLRGQEGVAWKTDELALGGLGPGSGSWAAGGGLSQSALVRPPRSLEPGEYGLSVRLYDPRGRRFLDPSHSLEHPLGDPKGAMLGVVTILPPGGR